MQDIMKELLLRRLSGELTGIRVLDASIADSNGLERMALGYELSELETARKAKLEALNTDLKKVA